MHIHVCIYIYIYIQIVNTVYIYIERERYSSIIAMLIGGSAASPAREVPA